MQDRQHDGRVSGPGVRVQAGGSHGWGPHEAGVPGHEPSTQHPHHEGA